ncbi:hypothetical protein GCM10018791_03900 [Streptomyces zaomyceticus]|nr:hypothetical protein GCM10018791_03900 [Streptomyces zaomyceticus]
MPTSEDPSASTVLVLYRHAYPASLRAQPCCFSPTAATSGLPFVLLYRKPQHGWAAISSRRNRSARGFGRRSRVGGTVVLGPAGRARGVRRWVGNPGAAAGRARVAERTESV